MKFTPENITKLEPNQIFVFGSNLAGRHGLGAAKTAKDKFGAVYGVAKGLTGQCYAIPTKDDSLKTLSLIDISFYVDEFINFAISKPEYLFFVTKIGTGLAGLELRDIAPMFTRASKFPNIVLPKDFYIFMDSD